MAKEHHCPTCGPQPCNASTSRIHTCGVCAAVWDEMITDAKPAPPPAPPSAPSAAPAAPARPPVPAPAAKPAPVAPTAPTAPPAAPKAPPAPAIPPPRPAPPAMVSSDPPGRPAKRLSELVATAKVARCPSCLTEPLNHPSDFLEVQSRIVFLDSQSYRGHMWFGDTGEPYRPSPAPPVASPKAAA